MSTPLRVGIIGASPKGSWSTRAHLPALRAMPQFELRTVCSSNLASAEAVAAQYGAHRAVADAAAVLEDPRIDLVAVCVRVQHHAQLVHDALRAGKHVLCEWPLAMRTEDAVELRQAAARAGVVDAVGLQARFSPVVNHMRDLVREGKIGDILAFTAIHSAPHSTRSAYLQDDASGGNALTIPGGHTLDLLQYTLGPVVSLSCSSKVSIERVRVDDTGHTVRRTAADQVVMTLSLAGGALGVFHLTCGTSGGTGFRLEVHGTRGDLVLLSEGAPPAVQMATLHLFEVIERELRPVATPAHYRIAPAGTPEGQPFNVAQLYASLAACIGSGRRFTPDFDSAVGNHRLLDAVREAARAGRSIEVR